MDVRYPLRFFQHTEASIVMASVVADVLHGRQGYFFLTIGNDPMGFMFGFGFGYRSVAAAKQSPRCIAALGGRSGVALLSLRLLG
jgi:hypothetical protein